MKTASELLLSSATDGVDLRTVDPETQARLEALLEAAGIGKLSTADGKAFADPEVLRRLTSSVSCALDEAAAALTRMRAENTLNAGQADNNCSSLVIFRRSVNEHTEEGESLLCLACSAGYYELAQVLLAMHANVEDRGIKGDITPLMAAASGGYVDIVKLLLVHGADVNAQSSTGNTALTYACAGGFVDVVKVLLKEGANIEDHNENGHTPLMEAASAGHVEVARVLLEYGAGINTHSNEFKESALTLACYKGHLDMVRFLLEAGADQEHKTDEMHTALMEACMDGHVEVARLLLDSGAQVNMPADSFESPLTLAACGGHVELAALLIERGANLEEVNDEGYTPLMEAAREGHEEMVALLLAQGANINAQTEETQETALTLACCGGFLEVADFLIKAGADIELGCSTPLMEAAQEGHLELVKYLLAAAWFCLTGANVHATTATGDTALTYACENGHTDVADVLLQAGANLEHESEGGRTPLMKAARAGHLCTVQFLISKGANVNRATANNDHTVVSLACAGGHLAVVELLLAHGADPTHRLKDGSTMLIEAAKGGHTNVVSYLLDYPNNILSVPAPDLSQLTPPSQDVPRVPFQALAMVVPPQEPDRAPSNIATPPPVSSKAALQPGVPSSVGRGPEAEPLPPFHLCQPLECIVEETEGKLNELGQRISAIEKAQLQSLELIQGEPLTKDKIEELKKSREEQVQKKKKILKELQKVERQLQLKTQQQFTKEYMEAKGLKEEQEPGQSQGPGPGPGSTAVPVLLPTTPGAQAAFVPIQPLPDYNPADYPGSTSPELQRVLVGQQMLGQQQQGQGQQLAGLGPGMIPQQAPDGLMVATPAQTLTDTLDDIMAAVSSRVPMLNTTTSPTPLSQPPTQTPANIASPPSVLPLYPSVDIDAHTESNHDTALTLACAGGHEELVSVLIARGANIEHRDKKGFTPLILAATAGHVGVVEVLLDKGGDIEAQSERTKDTPLSLACSGGRQEVVELLLLRGANKEHRNVSDYTPLSLAASGGYVNIIKILLNAGAEINSRTGSKLGISPLMLAAMNGHVPAVKLLLDMGSDINAQIETNRNTALTLACFQGRAEVVSLLLDRKANVEHRAKTGLTPLMEAASGGYAEVGRVLLDKGADVNAPPVPSSRDTALTIAADKGHYKFCELLINRGAHIDVRNKKGNTPLWLAANGGHFDVVQLLVHASADVDAADNRKITPLMAAFRKGHVKVVQYLVKEVNQFPSDIECMRYIATIADKELLKKCHQCMETIVKAKDQQAAEANKNASILLKELDLEKVMSGQSCLNKLYPYRQTYFLHGFVLFVTVTRGEQEASLETEVPIEPPSATTTTTIGISATSTTFTTAFGKKRASVATTPSTNRKNKKNKTKESSPNEPIILQDPQVSSSLQAPDTNDSTSSSLPSPFKTMALPITSPNSKLSLTSPKRGQKREEGWKEVVRRSKKLSVPASVVSRIMGRGGCNITAIQDVTGAHIDVDKQKDKNGERMITIRGGTESTRYAVQLINALIQDPAKELEDLIPRNHIRAPGSKTTSTSFPNTTGATSGSTTGPKALSSLVTSTGVSFQSSSSSSSSSSQAGGKIGKGLSSSVRQPFPVSLPLAYAHPQLALLAAQTMHQIRHPRLPMAQFGGTFSPAASTWGPFPVRPVSPGSANSSPKHNGGTGTPGGQARPNSAHSEHNNTASSGAPQSSNSSSSVRKQLFGPDPKPVVRGTGSPAHHSSTTTTANAPQQPVGPISQPPIQSTKTEPSAVAPPGKDKPSLPVESQPVSVSESISSVGFASPAMALPPKPEPRQQLPPTSSSVPSTEAPPPHLNPQPSSHLPSAPPPVLSHNVAHPNNTVPHFSAPAPRVSHRMQPPGPYYSLPEQQQQQTQQQQQQQPQSVFVPFTAQQEPPKQTQNPTSQPTSLPPQAQAPGSLQVSANLGMMNGSQMHHVASAGKPQQMAPNFPAGLFNFSSIFDNNNQVSSSTLYLPQSLLLLFLLLSNLWCLFPLGESPVPPPSTVSSSALSTSAVAPPPQPKPGSTSQQDRKVPQPIGTERLARIRQTGSVNPPLLTTSYTASVGQGGIWSFGVGKAMSGWSQPLMSSHMMHPQLQAEQSAFSQHQPMEQDDTGIANPANNYHQPQHMPNSYIDFPKGMPMSMYGGTMLPPHPPMAEGPGGPMYNGLHAGDPAWSPIIKVVPNNADNSDPQQQVWPGTWAPHVGNVHLNHVN
uniref:Ankyrin repeat and KH domain containing 1 n=1 Tax=Sphaeramia orbicularis TaxID=375764 RepID=A0A672ZZ36_9TELE